MSIDSGPSENEQAAAPHSGDNDLTRREFVRNTAVIAASTLAMGHVLSSTAAAASSRNARNKLLPLDLAEWSYFWVGVERAEVASGTYVNGKQMYVEYWLPREVKHPYPIVLVHGGGGHRVCRSSPVPDRRRRAPVRWGRDASLRAATNTRRTSACRSRRCRSPPQRVRHRPRSNSIPPDPAATVSFERCALKLPQPCSITHVPSQRWRQQSQPYCGQTPDASNHFRR